MRIHLFRQRQWLSLCMAIALLFAQFAIATHPLHLLKAADGSGGATVEISCAFCITGSNLISAPSQPAVRFERIVERTDDVIVRSVNEQSIVITSRVTRGPPISTTSI